MTGFSFEGNNDEYFARRELGQGAGTLVRLVFKLSGGRISTVNSANFVLILVALLFFILSGVVLWSGL
ncbi:MAG: hypothetical protein AAB453_03100 [Patescibacteria group bacterium]